MDKKIIFLFLYRLVSQPTNSWWVKSDCKISDSP